MKTYIVDIDGTIADNKHREWVLNEPGKKDWAKFFSMMKDDKPIEHMRTLLWHLNNLAKIVYFTGRPEAYRNVTINWILKHGYPTAGYLYMRADGDYRPDDIVKWEMYQKYLDKVGNEPPIMIFDDRNAVVKMWRINGVPCAQVAEGDF